MAGVWLATLLPALLFGPLAGALADRMDRRILMITGDVIRGLLFLSIPLFPNLTWIYAAKFLAGIGDMRSTACENVIGLDGIAIIHAIARDRIEKHIRDRCTR